MAALVPDVACCIFIGKKTFSTSQSNLAFFWDKCCPLTTCLHLMDPHWFANTRSTIYCDQSIVKIYLLHDFYSFVCLKSRSFDQAGPIFNWFLKTQSQSSISMTDLLRSIPIWLFQHFEPHQHFSKKTIVPIESLSDKLGSGSSLSFHPLWCWNNHQMSILEKTLRIRLKQGWAKF